MKNFFANTGFKISKFFYTFKNKWILFWSTKEITKKLLYTLLLLSIYILMTTIKAPFVNLANTNINDDPFLNTLNLVGGGGLKNFSLVALGISPFINASLIMSLLQTKLFPPIQKLSQSGPQGRRKLNIITRILTLIIAFPQAILLTKSLGAGDNPFIIFNPIKAFHPGVTTFFVLPLILIAGSLFSLFIAEQITDKGLGNGTSLIIFVGIAFQLPTQFKGAFSLFVGSESTTAIFVGALKFLTYLFVYFGLLFIITLVYNAERHIPIQQIGAGRSRNINEMGKLPIKLNPGGIMPIIFASMLVSFPIMIARILPSGNSGKLWIEANMQFRQPLGLSLLILITFFFSYVIGLQQSKIDKISEDFAKNSTFIPGLRPGEETEDYLIGIVLRLCTFSGFYLVFLASFQYIMILGLNIPAIVSFGGTGMMILVSVALETIQQFLARRKSQHLAKQKRLSKEAAEVINFQNKYEENDPFASDDQKVDNQSKDYDKYKNGDGLLW
ncbi:preprotein translocase subunit SecY [Mycoplasmopsis caviae]|uniref:Protein translocase subunit SecY n=1 Tax=Mycoplasmopsis caviae TaxID=55603 RepID=A0A3P8LAD7_9BACT|nr:preprotein translocase subunit SecY [Mycoplasmopsis caviae]UUD35598.1 preprotein translocase subunit SecY [Mycoplasmopsis caviae]VDR41641.1 preprotein translocase subunit SecY [Mycoplasmopsis caviae]